MPAWGLEASLSRPVDDIAMLGREGDGSVAVAKVSPPPPRAALMNGSCSSIWPSPRPATDLVPTPTAFSSCGEGLMIALTADRALGARQWAGALGEHQEPLGRSVEWRRVRLVAQHVCSLRPRVEGLGRPPGGWATGPTSAPQGMLAPSCPLRTSPTHAPGTAPATCLAPRARSRGASNHRAAAQLEKGTCQA